ncbi:unnamed protein product [Orchesella dallaii]|uniref:Metalloendopeptidase n=1 Tax=Orchesella dallaii TaxID=48710 RepID=A0ABP1Q6L6_9HEXA
MASVLEVPLPPLPENPSRNTSFLESLLNPNQTKRYCTANEDERPQIRSGLKPVRYKWTEFNVFIDDTFDTDERSLINNALYKLNQVLPCIKFGIWPNSAKPSGDYVRIKKGNGCSSAIGRQGGVQLMSLSSPGCMSLRTILHEMIHALGFLHEQSRPDRDKYVSVMWENIQPGKEHNFIKRDNKEVNTFGIPYDSRSIMHYHPNDFSWNGQPTIISKIGKRIGPTQDLRRSDIKKLKKMYKC